MSKKKGKQKIKLFGLGSISEKVLAVICVIGCLYIVFIACEKAKEIQSIKESAIEAEI